VGETEVRDFEAEPVALDAHVTAGDVAEWVESAEIVYGEFARACGCEESGGYARENGSVERVQKGELGAQVDHCVDRVWLSQGSFR
jgi:hypothetical protein